MLVGRKKEIELLKKYSSTAESEFVVVYGRRRVGKTFLVRQHFRDKFFFYTTGVAPEAGEKANLRVNLEHFRFNLTNYGINCDSTLSSWMEAFDCLRKGIESSTSSDKKIIFLDEMPWMDTPKSSFISALEYFWNSFASARTDILLIACGSASTWISRKLLNNRGGLHNRITGKLLIRPFTLSECEEYFRYLNIVIDRRDIAEAYMIFGGIPYYLRYWDGRWSLPQNVDRIVFRDDAPLKNEFENMYASLFKNSAQYIDVVKALSTKSKGLFRDDILRITGMSDGGTLSEILQNLELSGFIRYYARYPGKIRNGLYQLIDNYSLFHLTFVEGNLGQNENFWSDMHETPKLNTWRGYAFEQLCLKHIDQVKWALGIAGTATDAYSWKSKESNPGAQIDLALLRSDRIVNICEIKFSKYEFAITKDYAEKLRNKLFSFGSETGSKSTLHLTLITTYGIKQNAYSNMVQSEVRLEDLFNVPGRN
ncbi:MAG: ATP-binding protein [Oscillospiraceae bacterium]|nr:ATP-binding protein [Oscillospiraceae bacterium]